MKRIIALWMALMMLAGAATVFAEARADVPAETPEAVPGEQPEESSDEVPDEIPAAEEPEIFCYDFRLRFHLEADAFPAHEREHAQGYADLLEMLEFRGNVAWCPKNGSMDLQLSLVPLSNPDAAVSIRIYGLPKYWLRVTSPLLGEEAVCFQPGHLMAFGMRAWETFQLPLPKLMLLIPRTTLDAFQCLADVWDTEIGRLRWVETIPHETMEKVADGWREQLETNESLRSWITAVTETMSDGELVRSVLEQIPDMLLDVFGSGDLAVEAGTNKLILTNPDGNTIYEWRQTAQGAHVYRFALTPAETKLDYVPSVSYRWDEREEGFVSIMLKAALERASENTQLPDCIFRLKVQADHLPDAYPADSEFTVRISSEGFLLPEGTWTITGKTSPDGKIRVSATRRDQPEAIKVLTCTGSVTPAERTEPLAYMIGDIHSEYNLFALGDESLSSLVNSVKEAFTAGIIDFLYEIPASACQSILDDLEHYGLLQTLLQQ